MVGGSVPPVLLCAVHPRSGGSPPSAAGHRKRRSHIPAQPSGQKHGAGQRSHHGAFGGGHRQAGEGDVTSGAAAALFQDA